MVVQWISRGFPGIVVSSSFDVDGILHGVPWISSLEFAQESSTGRLIGVLLGSSRRLTVFEVAESARVRLPICFQPQESSAGRFIGVLLGPSRRVVFSSK